MTSANHHPFELDDQRLADALDALALLDADARRIWLDERARTEPDLAAQLRTLLDDMESLDTLDDGPGLLADDLTATHGLLPPGTRLGAWQLCEPLGSGGMGRVYLAERADGAFEKQVAIKVLRRERRLPDAVIEHERALLARLEHPGLTRLLDGGISDQGDVYLVMELVKGPTLAQWCRQGNPTMAQRLALFEQILAAVAHAHRQLVVHGDLKPDNVIVTSEQHIKVLDFGVARLLNSEPSTLPAAVTPGWVAPECANGAQPNVVSDIHNLGRLLEFLASAAPAGSQARIPTDLAAIIAKATATQPEARYSSTGSMAADLRRYQLTRPVNARQGGALYVAQRFMQRHWIGVGFAVLILGLVVGAGRMIVHQDQIVRGERDSARIAAERSQTVLDYLLAIMGEASQVDVNESASMRNLLNDSLSRISTDFGDDPQAHQALLVGLGELMIRMRDFSSADKILADYATHVHEGMDAQLRARALDNLAQVRLHQGDLDEAARLAGQARELLRTLPSDQRGPLSEVRVTEAQIQSRQGDLPAAIQTLRQALSLRLAVSPPESAQTVVVRNSLAVALLRSGQLSEALRQFRQIQSALETSQRENSLDAATVYANYASTAFTYGRYAEAHELYQKALTLQEKLYGPSASFAALLNNAGKLNLALGHLDTGGEQIHRAAQMMAEFAGEDSVDAQLIRLSLGQLALELGESASALEIFEDVIARLAAKIGDTHPLLTQVRAEALIARARAQNLPASNRAFDRMLEQLQGSSNQRPRTRLLLERATLALEQKRFVLARDSAAACASERAQSLADNSPPLLLAQFIKASAEAHLTPSTDSQGERERILQKLHTQLGEQHPAVQHLASL